MCFVCSRHGTAGKPRRSHLNQDTVEPLKGSVEVQLDPARSGGDRLTPVLGAPSLDKTHADCAHPRQLVDRFESLTHRLRQHGREFLVVEYLQVTALKARIFEN